MIALTIHPILKESLVQAGYIDIEIFPINGYGDTSSPFITWIEFPSTRNNEQYWLRQSSLTYYVYDNDLSRGKDISKHIDSFLNIGDDVSSIKDEIVSSDYRLCWSRLVGGGMFPALERDGYTSITRTFEVGYIDV